MSPPGPFAAKPAQLLLVLADARAADRLAAELAMAFRQPAIVTRATSGRGALDRLRLARFDAVLVSLADIADLSSPDDDRIGRLARQAEGALLLALAADGSVTEALAAMRGGAHDCVALASTGRALARRLAELGAQHDPAHAATFGLAIPHPRAGATLLVGQSSQMQVIEGQIERAAALPDPVFITGPSGSGKDLVASALHERSAAASGPFIAFRAAALAGATSLSALFGAGGTPGALEQARDGMLYIDEISDLDATAQAHLLHVLQAGTAQRVGGDAPYPVTMRLVCATRHNPMQLIAERRFREDLFYRLHVLPIHLPPLRQRQGDVALLAEHFLEAERRRMGRDLAGFTPEALAALEAADWPGNVRELANFVRRIVAFAPPGPIGADLVAEARGEAAAPSAAQPTRAIEPLWRQEQRIIEDAIALCRGNITLAAQALELSPSTIYRKRLAWAELEARQGQQPARRQGAA